MSSLRETAEKLGGTPVLPPQLATGRRSQFVQRTALHLHVVATVVRGWSGDGRWREPTVEMKLFAYRPPRGNEPDGIEQLEHLGTIPSGHVPLSAFVWLDRILRAGARACGMRYSRAGNYLERTTADEPLHKEPR